LVRKNITLQEAFAVSILEKGRVSGGKGQHSAKNYPRRLQSKYLVAGKSSVTISSELALSTKTALEPYRRESVAAGLWTFEGRKKSLGPSGHHEELWEFLRLQKQRGT